MYLADAVLVAPDGRVAEQLREHLLRQDFTRSLSSVNNLF